MKNPIFKEAHKYMTGATMQVNDIVEIKSTDYTKKYKRMFIGKTGTVSHVQVKGKDQGTPELLIQLSGYEQPIPFHEKDVKLKGEKSEPKSKGKASRG